MFLSCLEQTGMTELVVCSFIVQNVLFQPPYSMMHFDGQFNDSKILVHPKQLLIWFLDDYF